MEVYLVRHGQTGGNVAKRHQAEHTPLSFAGEEQARLVAERIKSLKPTHLISSPLVRALETARFINEGHDFDIETNYDFIELRRPTYLYGRNHFSVPSLFYYVLWFAGREDERLAGESYRSVLERIERVKKYLASYPSDARVIVVSHSVFMNLLVMHLCREKPMSLFEAFKTFYGVVKMPNTAVIPLNYTIQEEQVCPWRVDE